MATITDTGHRYRHLFVVGHTGAGKSAWLENLISQDAKRENGVILFDPQGLANHRKEQRSNENRR